jgi:hypothetical protein
MVQSESQQHSVAGPELIDGRDCFAEAYVARPPHVKGGRNTPGKCVSRPVGFALFLT